MTQLPELILLIEDDEDDIFFHRKAILDSGLDCRIDVCTSGDTAMDYLSNQGEYLYKGNNYPKPNLILLDINMPRVDGWQFLDLYSQWIEGRPHEPSAIIVMISTSTNSPDIERAKSIPIVDRYVAKPLKPKLIKEIVDDLFPA